MLPTYKSGDRVLVLRWGSVKAGDTVVFRKNGMKLVKRIAVKASDRFTMIGDNIKHSTDSLDFGDVSKDEIIGRVVATY